MPPVRENYSGCPICNRKVDTSSPFFLPAKKRRAPKERVRFKRLELCTDLEGTVRTLFEDFCARTQALNPTDKLDFQVLMRDFGAHLPSWLPESIPLKENVALVLARLFVVHAPADVLPLARAHLKTIKRAGGCFFGCDEYDELAAAIERHEQGG